MAQVLETPEQATVADGATAAFPIAFTFSTGGEVRVEVVTAAGVRTLQTADVDYVISGANVVFLSGHLPPAGAQVERLRRTPAEQPVPFGDDATFRPVANEEAFDRQTRLVQEDRARTGRALAVPVGETGMILPPPAVRAGRLFVGGGSGAALTMLEGAEEAVILNAAGQAATIPLTALFAEIGTTLLDDGEWLAADDPASNDDGVFG